MVLRVCSFRFLMAPAPAAAATGGPANKMPDDVAMLKFATLDPTVVFQPALAQPVINLAAAASPANQYNTFVALDEDYVSRFPKLYFVNLDAGKAMTLSIWGDE